MIRFTIYKKSLVNKQKYVFLILIVCFSGLVILVHIICGFQRNMKVNALSRNQVQGGPSRPLLTLS